MASKSTNENWIESNRQGTGRFIRSDRFELYRNVISTLHPIVISRTFYGQHNTRVVWHRKRNIKNKIKIIIILFLLKYFQKTDRYRGNTNKGRAQSVPGPSCRIITAKHLNMKTLCMHSHSQIVSCISQLIDSKTV